MVPSLSTGAYVMSAMEQMLVSVLKQVIPESLIDALSQENVLRFQARIASEWGALKTQLDTIEANTNALVAQSGAAGYGARMFMGEGIILDTVKEPEDALRLEAGILGNPDNDGNNSIGNPLPGWEQYYNRGGSRPNSNGSGNHSTGGGSSG
jgi:hypothetical protein